MNKIDPIIPLERQIKAVEREIAMRKVVYAKKVEEKKMLQAVADAEIAAMESTLKTLSWLLDHRADIIAAVKEREELRALPEVMAIDEAFPGATMAVRRIA